MGGFGCGGDQQQDAICSGEEVFASEVHRILAPGRDVSPVASTFDGSVVVGDARSPDRSEAFRWTKTSGFMPLGLLEPAHSTRAVAVSADGAVVVGTSLWHITVIDQAFRWTEAAGLVRLDVRPPQGKSWPAAVSRDGSVVVGGLSPEGRAFRWTESGGLVVLEPPPGASNATATHVSADGSVVIGIAYYDSSPSRMFRWTEQTGSIEFGPTELTGADFMSNDGSVFVGHNGPRAAPVYRWSERTGFVSLGPLPGFSRSRATGLSSDGSVVIGACDNDKGEPYFPPSQRAFRWTVAAGLEALDLVPREAPSRANHAMAVSSDGTIVVGADIFYRPDVPMEGVRMELVQWNQGRCPARVRSPHGDPLETFPVVGGPTTLSGDGRTLIGTHPEGRSLTGWLLTLP